MRRTVDTDTMTGEEIAAAINAVLADAFFTTSELAAHYGVQPAAVYNRPKRYSDGGIMIAGSRFYDRLEVKDKEADNV